MIFSYILLTYCIVTAISWLSSIKYYTSKAYLEEFIRKIKKETEASCVHINGSWLGVGNIRIRVIDDNGEVHTVREFIGKEVQHCLRGRSFDHIIIDEVEHLGPELIEQLADNMRHGTFEQSNTPDIGVSR